MDGIEEFYIFEFDQVFNKESWCWTIHNTEEKVREIVENLNLTGIAVGYSYTYEKKTK